MYSGLISKTVMLWNLEYQSKKLFVFFSGFTVSHSQSIVSSCRVKKRYCTVKVPTQLSLLLVTILKTKRMKRVTAEKDEKNKQEILTAF